LKTHLFSVAEMAAH